MCLLSTLISNVVQVLQVVNSCNSTLLMLLGEFDKSEKALEAAVNERNRSLRRYIRQRERYMLRNPPFSFERWHFVSVVVMFVVVIKWFALEESFAPGKYRVEEILFMS